MCTEGFFFLSPCYFRFFRYNFTSVDESFQQKQNTYEQIIGFIPEAIILLSGGTIKEKGKDGLIKFRSTKIDEGDAFGLLWGEARVLAVGELATHFPQALIIMTSTPAIFEELEQFSIPPERFILEGQSTNTFSQIGEAMKIVHERKLKRVIFITNEYHVPRARAMYESFGLNTVQVRFVAAETVLPYWDKKYIKIIDKVKKTPVYEKRVQSEERGLLMIKNGEYGKNKTSNSDKSERKL